jgi:hypothetical protein
MGSINEGRSPNVKSIVVSFIILVLLVCVSVLFVSKPPEQPQSVGRVNKVRPNFLSNPLGNLLAMTLHGQSGEIA